MRHGMWKANRADVLGEPALLPLKSSLQPPQTVSPMGESCFDGVQLLHTPKCPFEPHSARKPSQHPHGAYASLAPLRTEAR